MKPADVFDKFESLDIDDAVRVQRADGSRQVWSIYDVHLEDEGLYVQYFSLGQGTVDLAFIPAVGPSVITAVKNW